MRRKTTPKKMPRPPVPRLKWPRDFIEVKREPVDRDVTTEPAVRVPAPRSDP